MVVLSISPYRGNHQRFFPFAGFLGLTPVVIQGTLKTVMEEDNKPLKASSVFVRVRCYEADISGGATKGKGMNVLFDAEQELWRKDEGEEFTSLGDFSKAFRIVIPVEANGVTTATFKNFRTWWQVEAVINHKPTALDGSRRLVSHQLPLTRFTPPDLNKFPAPAWQSSPYEHSLAAERGLHYSFAAQSSVYGPSEPIDITFSFHKADPTLQIRKIQICLDRHVTLNGSSGSGSDLDDVPVPEAQPNFSPFSDENSYTFPKSTKPAPKGITSVFGKRPSLSKSPTMTNSVPLAPHPSDTPYTLNRASPPTSTIPLGPRGTAATSILIIESDEGALDLLGNGIEARVLGLVPKTKSLYRYSVGESMRTKFAHVQFILSIKIYIKSKVGGNEVIELGSRSVKITSASDADRTLARLDAGRILSVADAELRLYDNSVTSLITPPSTHISLDDDCAPAFVLTESSGMLRSLSVDDDELALSPTRFYQGSRRRSDQSEGTEAPRRSRARMSPARSTSPREDLPQRVLSTVYLASPLPPSTLDFSAYSLSTGVALPLLPHFTELCAPDLGPKFGSPLSSPPCESSPRQSRRAGRSSTPYSSSGRRGPSSIKSGRPSSISSSHSGTSIASGGRYTRERSLPVLSNLPNVQPLSLYSVPSSTFSEIESCIIEASASTKTSPSPRPSTAPHSTVPPLFYRVPPTLGPSAEELAFTTTELNQRSFSRPVGSNVNRKFSTDGVTAKDHKLWSFLKRTKA